MSDDANDPYARTTKLSVEALQAKLVQLIGSSAADLIDFRLPDRHSNTTASNKHNARTARYKKTKALNLAPDSEAVATACAFIVLKIIRRDNEFSHRIGATAVRSLMAAGYEQKESEIAVRRLAKDVSKRKEQWEHRTRVRLGQMIADELRDERGNA